MQKEKIGGFEINNIYHTDSNIIIKTLPSKCIDLLVIDPPYLLDTRGGGFRKKRDYYDTLHDKNLHTGITISMLDELVRVMTAVNMYIFCNKNQLEMYLSYFKDYNIDLLIWYKKNPIPVINNKYLSDIEYIVYVREKGVKLHGDYSSLSKIYISNTNRVDKKNYIHPTIKPIELVKRFVSNSSLPNDLVADFYIGSGTTCIAAKELGRRYIGFEIDRVYYDIAQNRLNGINVQGQTSMFTDFDKLNKAR